MFKMKTANRPTHPKEKRAPAILYYCFDSMLTSPLTVSGHSPALALMGWVGAELPGPDTQ